MLIVGDPPPKFRDSKNLLTHAFTPCPLLPKEMLSSDVDINGAYTGKRLAQSSLLCSLRILVWGRHLSSLCSFSTKQTRFQSLYRLFKTDQALKMNRHVDLPKCDVQVCCCTFSIKSFHLRRHAGIHRPIFTFPETW